MATHTISLTSYDEYIRAAPDIHLSSSQTHLLSTLLSQEDQHDYNQIIHIQLSDDILHIVHQVTLLPLLSQLSSSYFDSSFS